MLTFLCCWLGLVPCDGSDLNFTFQDVAEVDGCIVLFFQSLEMAEKPVRPLAEHQRFSPQARFGLLPVGTDPDTALSCVWDPRAKGGAVLWLDADGDGRLSAQERFAVPDKECSVAFTLTIRKGEGEDMAQRTVVFRRSTLRPGLSYAVRGCVRGKLRFDEVTFDTVVLDANGDGCFHGAGVDRLWIDFNRDGRFDPLTEQFSLGRPFAVAGVTYIISADPLGKRVHARRRGSETGKLRIYLPARIQHQVKTFQADLINDLGELVSLHAQGKALEVPCGKYHLSSVRLVLTDADQRDWHYALLGYGPAQHEVSPRAERAIAILTDCRLTIYHDAKPAGVRPGTEVVVRPFLHDADHLYFRDCFTETGRLQAPGKAVARMRSQDGRIFHTYTSGFN